MSRKRTKGSLSPGAAPDLAAAVVASGLLPNSGSLLVGVSGGPDSLALLHSLTHLPNGPALEVTAAHFDHRLRTGGSKERDYVEACARKWGAEFRCGSGDVRALAQATRRGIEESSREARYEFLAAAAAVVGAGCVAVAHTLDDQAETVLLNILRGSGIQGLGGMRYSRLLSASPEVALVRPFLNTWRSDVLAYCRAHDIQPLQDPSNRSLSFTRNRVRLELLPYLSERYNPRIKERLVTLARLVAQDDDLRSHLAEHLLLEAFHGSTGQTMLLAAGPLEAAPPALAAASLRLAFERAAGDAITLDWRCTQRLLSLLSHRRARQVDAGGGWTARRVLLGRGSQSEWFIEIAPQPAHCEPSKEFQPVPLPVPGRVELPEFGRWVQVQPREAPQSIPPDPAAAYIDAGAVRGALQIRGIWRGARFRPLGMSGEKKLGDFLTDRKVPRDERARQLLVVDEEKIVWVVGRALDDRVRIVPGSRSALHLTTGAMDASPEGHMV